MQTNFVGFTCLPAPDAERFQGPLVPPSNYKNEKTIAEWLEKATADRYLESAFLPVLGALDTICIINEDGDIVFEHNGCGTGNPDGAVRCSRFLRGRLDIVDRVVGFCVHNFMRIMVLEGLRSRSPDVLSVDHILGSEGDSSLSVIDPYKLLPEKTRKYVSVSGFLDWFSLPNILGEAILEARAARALSHALRLF